MNGANFRDVDALEHAEACDASRGRNLIAVAGIDRYRGWPLLSKAVNDARGALEIFTRLGFTPVCPPLLDDMASGETRVRPVPDVDALVAALVWAGTDESLQLLVDDHLDGRAHGLPAPGGEVVFEVGLRRNHELGSVSLEGSFCLLTGRSPRFRNSEILPSFVVGQPTTSFYTTIGTRPVRRWGPRCSL